MAYAPGPSVYPDPDVSERASASSWLPPESSSGEELAEERMRLMAAAAAAASEQPASPAVQKTSWLPAEPASVSTTVEQPPAVSRVEPQCLLKCGQRIVVALCGGKHVSQAGQRFR